MSELVQPITFQEENCNKIESDINENHESVSSCSKMLESKGTEKSDQEFDDLHYESNDDQVQEDYEIVMKELQKESYFDKATPRNITQYEKLHPSSKDEKQAPTNNHNLTYRKSNMCNLNNRRIPIKPFNNLQQKSLKRRQSMQTIEKHKTCYKDEQVQNNKNSKPIHYKHIGWIDINTNLFYIHAGRAIGPYNIDLRGDSCFKLVYDSKYSEKAAFDLMIDMTNIAPKRITVPLLLYNLLATLNHLFRIARYEPRTVLWIHGLTGSKKTELGKIFTCIFNRDEEDYIPATFFDTPSSIDPKFTEYKDCAFLLDDYCPTSSYKEKRNMEEIVTKVVRSIGDRTSKSRMNRDMNKQKEFRPLGLCVVTGEDLPTGHSRKARIIGVEVNKDDVNEEILSIHQSHKTAYSTAISNFIKWVANNVDWVVAFIKNEFSFGRQLLKGRYNHARFVDAHIHFEAILKILMEYAVSSGLIDNKRKLTIHNECSKAIAEVILNNNDELYEEGSGKMYLKAIKDLIDSGQERLIKINNISRCKTFKSVGYEDEENIYLHPGTAYQAVFSYYKRESKLFPLSKMKTHEALDDLNVIVTATEKRNGRLKKIRTVKKSLPSLSSNRYLIIKKEQMSKVLYD